jgi:hypothetical protein
MPIRLVVAVTDRDWFEHLRSRPEITEVNFWSPGTASFRALEPGELFFFKLHAPDNYIAGFGVSPIRMRFRYHVLSPGTRSATQMEQIRLKKCVRALRGIASCRQTIEAISQSVAEF